MKKYKMDPQGSEILPNISKNLFEQIIITQLGSLTKTAKIKIY